LNVTKISIERPTLVVVVFSVFAFLGALSYLYLSYELTPKFTPPVSAITTIYLGASPQEVENSVTRPIEDAISSLEKVDRIFSISQENISVVKFELQVGADVDKGLIEAQRKVNAILGQLPASIQGPNLSRFDFDDLPVLRLGAFSDLEESDFFDLARTKLQPELSQIEGVAQIRLLGGQEREIRVSVDPLKLKVYGLSILHITKAINLTNLDFPAGKLTDQENQVYIRLAGKLRSLQDLEDLIIAKNPGGSVVKLKNVARVEDHIQDPEIISRTNGRNSLGIDIKKQSDANAVDMSRKVKQRLAEMELEHQDIGLEFELAQDSSLFTLKAANEVMEDLLLAVILVSLIMLLFLHSLRNALIVFVSIPTSIITTFIVVYLLGYSLNLMTLLGSELGS